MTSPLRIALNGRFSGTAQPTGTQTVAFHLFDAVIRAPRREGETVVAFADPRFPGVAAWRDVPGTELVEVPFQDWPRWRAQLWEQLAFPVLARRKGANVGHHPITTCPSWHNGVKTVVTLHDLNFYLHPEWYSRAFRLAFALCAVPGVRRADRVVTISDYVRGQIAEHLRIPAERLFRVHNGNRVPPPASAAVPTPGGAGEYLLCVGSLQPHKNLPRLIEAFLRLRAEGFPDLELRVVGRPQPRFAEQPELTALFQKPGVRILGYLSDEELYAAYRGALAFCYPSLEEGFGLPLLEAMSVGTPVMTSNVSCLPEIAGPAAELADPLDVDALAASIARVLRWSPEERAARIARGREWETRFTWENGARAYWEIYRNLVLA